MIKIKSLKVGSLETNCYLAWCPQTLEGVIIDPADNPNFINNQIRDLNLKPKKILVTHGHFDHLAAVNPLKMAFQIPFLIHQNDEFLIERLNRSAKYWLGDHVDYGPPPSPDEWLKEGQKITFGHEALEVLETPGHTPGSVSFFSKEILFSGDTLFFQGVGRTDFSYASSGELDQSLKKLFKLPEKTKVYPGHGPETILGQEKIFLSNPQNYL